MNTNKPPVKGFYILALFLVLMMAFSVLACDGDDGTGRYDGDKGTNIIQVGYDHADIPDCFGKGVELGLCETGK